SLNGAGSDGAGTGVFLTPVVPAQVRLNGAGSDGAGTACGLVGRPAMLPASMEPAPTEPEQRRRATPRNLGLDRLNGAGSDGAGTAGPVLAAGGITLGLNGAGSDGAGTEGAGMLAGGAALTPQWSRLRRSRNSGARVRGVAWDEVPQW